MQSLHTTKDQQLFTAHYHTGGKQHPALKARWKCVMAFAYTLQCQHLGKSHLPLLFLCTRGPDGTQ